MSGLSENYFPLTFKTNANLKSMFINNFTKILIIFFLIKTEAGNIIVQQKTDYLKC